jgi:murein DD-endopeptidase MepM/ murein hydrolase activator NlpD
MKRRIRLTSIIAFAVLLLGPAAAATAWAGSVSNQDRYDAVQARLAAAQANIEAAKLREAELSSQVAAFDAQLGALSDSLARLDAQIAGVRQRLDKTRARLAQARKELRLATARLRNTTESLAYQQELFEQRVVAMYKKDDISYFDVLLGSSGWEDLISRVGLVRTLVESDNDLVGELQVLRAKVADEKQQLAASETELAGAEADLADQSDRLAGLRAEAAAQQQSLALARAAKSDTLQQVAANRRQWEEQEDQLQAESNQLSAIIAGGSSGGAHGSGQLIWPVAGPVTSGFGWRIHPIFHVRKFHTGIDISAAYGVAIKAADTGTTIYSGWMTGYGNVVVVDHGNGLSTLYAHMTAAAVGNGVNVTRGQTIGTVGATGYATGPHLHFEVRVNGDPVDPLGYLP